MFRKLVPLFLFSCIASHGGEQNKLPVRRAVLVHGILQNDWRCFGFLRRDLEARGVECLVPALKPADGRLGIPAMSRQLQQQITQRFGNEKFVLIGFSMGGLVSRHYLQDLGGARRCDAFFSISSPHHGTEMAKFFYGEGARQMRPDSDFLKSLSLSEKALGDMPVVSYRTPADLVILPSTSSHWDRADNVVVPCPLHPMMTASPKVREDILRRLGLPSDLGVKAPPPGRGGWSFGQKRR